MKSMRFLLGRLLRNQRRSLLWGLLLSLAVLLSGIALLGLSGWFVTAAGLAGLAGAGQYFDIFRPSAGVRFLALGRTAARYGERMTTHDATLRVLAAWRGQLLGALALSGTAVQSRLRSGAVLNRLTADVDALDGLAIRLVFPLLAGVLSLAIAGAFLWWLVLPAVALWVIGLPLAGAVLIASVAGPVAARQAAEAEEARQDLRAQMIDHLRGRSLLTVEGRLPSARQSVLNHDKRARAAALRLASIEIGVDAMIATLTSVNAAGALLLAGQAALDGRIGVAQAALAFFAALGVAEVIAPLSRGIGEFGRMRGAADRLVPLMHQAPRDGRRTVAGHSRGGLQLDEFVAGRGGVALIGPLDLTVSPGETVAIGGRSGVGKTTLLDTIAGLRGAISGEIAMGNGACDEAGLRRILGYLTQRPALTSGTVADALRLADGAASTDAMVEVLAAVALPLPLDRQLGEAGQGLSGGEARRLALARVLIRRPAILLLDEPTEGLDAATAKAVLAGLRAYLPDAAILIASHRPAERAAADRVIWL